VVSFEVIEEKVKAALPEATVDIRDLGGGDHLSMRVVCAAFSGKSRVARHRMVYAALTEEMKGPIHALQLETLTPEEEE
jgi:stress-induced morphogen